MAIPITPGTNAQLYTDAVRVAKALKELQNTCANYAERMYYIGIPNHATAPVDGFVDADNLTTEDVLAALSLTLDTRDFMNQSRLQICAAILRNETA